MNALDNLFGNIKGDVTVNVAFDPGSLVLMALMIIIAIVLSHVAVKAIL